MNDWPSASRRSSPYRPVAVSSQPRLASLGSVARRPVILNRSQSLQLSWVAMRATASGSFSTRSASRRGTAPGKRGDPVVRATASARPSSSQESRRSDVRASSQSAASRTGRPRSSTNQAPSP